MSAGGLAGVFLCFDDGVGISHKGGMHFDRDDGGHSWEHVLSSPCRCVRAHAWRVWSYVVWAILVRSNKKCHAWHRLLGGRSSPPIIQHVSCKAGPQGQPAAGARRPVCQVPPPGGSFWMLLPPGGSFLKCYSTTCLGVGRSPCEAAAWPCVMQRTTTGWCWPGRWGRQCRRPCTLSRAGCFSFLP